MDRYSLLKDFDSRYLLVHQPSVDEVPLTLEGVDPSDVVIYSIFQHGSLSRVSSGLYVSSCLDSFSSKSLNGLNFQQQINRIFLPGTSKHRSMTQFREMRDHSWGNHLRTLEELLDSWKSQAVKDFKSNAERFSAEYELLYGEKGLIHIP